MVIAAGVWCWIRWSFRVLWADAGCRECVCRQERGGGSSSRTQQGEGGHVGLDRNRNDLLDSHREDVCGCIPGEGGSGRMDIGDLSG